MEEREIRIDEVFNILKKRWKLILAFTLIATAMAAIMSFYIITPMYKTSTKFFIGKELEGTDNKYSANDIQVYQKFLNTYAEVITTNDLIKNAINANDLEVSASTVLAGLTVTPKTDTQILQLSYTCSNKEMTKKILDAVSDEFIKEADSLIPNGDVRVIQQSTMPGAPSSPNKLKNIVVGFFVGFMIGILVAFFIEYFNNTVKNEEDIEEIMGVPVIGLIPVEDK